MCTINLQLNICTSLSIESTFAEPFFDTCSNEKEKYNPQEWKVKIKKRGTPNRGRETSQPGSLESPPNETHYISINGLITNKNAIKTFKKLFSFHQRANCFDNEIKISLHKITALFQALHQDFALLKGHGSHKKGTLNFQAVGSDMEEQMIILTKAMYLKPYQIRQIREAFFNAGIVPEDTKIIEKLEEDFLGILRNVQRQ